MKDSNYDKDIQVGNFFFYGGSGRKGGGLYFGMAIKVTPGTVKACYIVSDRIVYYIRKDGFIGIFPSSTLTLPENIYIVDYTTLDSNLKRIADDMRQEFNDGEYNHKL
jgi:hypothetical protein